MASKIKVTPQKEEMLEKEGRETPLLDQGALASYGLAAGESYGVTIPRPGASPTAQSSILFAQAKKLKAARSDRCLDHVARKFVRRIPVGRDGAYHTPGLELTR